MKKLNVFLLFIISLFLFSCKNAFEDVEKKDTDEVIYHQALLELNKRNYTGAIFLFESLSPAVKASRAIAADYASAYSGRCGLDFLGLLANLENISSFNTIYSFLLNIYPGGSDDRIADCLEADTILNAVGDVTVRNPEENLLMAFSSLTKIGVILDRYADTDDDDVIDAGFDHCDVNDLPDEAVREIGEATANAITSAAASGASINADTLTEIQQFCDDTDPSFCNTTDGSTFSGPQVLILRAAIGSSDFGIGSCTGDLVACVCP